MSFRCVRTVSRFCNYSSAHVPCFLLIRCNAAPATIFVSPSFNFRFLSSDTAPSDAVEKRTNLVLNNFSVFSIFQNWKKKLNLQDKEVSSVDAAEKTTPSAIELAPNLELKTTPLAIELAPNLELKTTPSAIDLALNSVVKVFTVSSQPRIFQPWQISMQSGCTGSGFVISGKKIITNAHVVADHTSVKVRKHGSSTKYKAKVKAIGHECDLAILEIDSEEFWEGMNPLELGDIPSLQGEVFVVGYPKGGDTISITKGVVSRVELREYSHSGSELLAIQIDAAINSENSGGPVIMGNKVAGVAFQSLYYSSSIGYIIPTPVIKHFLNGVEESGHHVSFCSMDLQYQTMGNIQIRNHFKMSKEMTGILINRINPLSDAHKVLKKNDVILAIDGVPIGNDGEVPFRNQERITFKHLVSMKKPCDTALFKVLREGKEYEFNTSLKPVPPLVPVHHFDKLPSYYIFGGLVFMPLSQPYIDRAYICECSLQKMPEKIGQQIVIISQILEDDITTEYNVFEDSQVKKVNGVEVDNLKHLCQLIEECNTVDLVLELEKDKTLVLHKTSAKRATCKILKQLKIPSAMSADLQPRHQSRRRMVPRHSKKD